MNIIQAFILGILQGIGEFLPISSSGHLEIAGVLLGIKDTDNLAFVLVVHAATVLSTIIIFRKEILALIKGIFKFQWNEETQYFVKIVISMLPAVIIGLFFKDIVEEMFKGNLLLVGISLIITALLLTFAYYAKSKDREISFIDALIIGIVQAIAITPGISRSGSTISTGLMLGNNKESVARFSFLMVIPLILGANAKEVLDSFHNHTSTADSVGIVPLIVGFVTAFVVGLFACKTMINLVKRGKLVWFAIYCSIIGLLSVLYGVLH